ncbi:hypothetical protein U1Q18_020559 [Sarracenia purpurea var. burkii]
MPQRNSTRRDQPDSIVSHRRSPRLLPKVHTAPEDLKSPDPKSRTSRVPCANSLTSAQKTHKHCPEEFPKNVKESKSGSKFSGKFHTQSSSRSATLSGGFCLRRSPRFSGDTSSLDEVSENKIPPKCYKEGLSNVGKVTNLCEQVVPNTEKRMTRSSSRRNINECVKNITSKDNCDVFMRNVSIEASDKEDLPGVGRAEVGAKSCKHILGKLEKRTIHSSLVNKDRCNDFIKIASTKVPHEEDLPNEERAKVGANLCNKFGGKLDEEEEKKERDHEKGTKEIGAKRKRNQVKEGHAIVQGWTKDQELALQRAYFAAKPTPHFWKKVAKLVPGKCAKDCFDKVHSDHLTPPQPRTRLKARKTNSPTLLLFESTLLKPADRRPSGRRHRSHLAQKTVRKLLQKHYTVDENYETDLFSVLESTFSPSTSAFQQGVIDTTPERVREKPGYLKKCHERSSSANKKKTLSRLSNLYGATLVSPPVLKHVKNKDLHEKYIDRLHFREAKRRRAASAQSAKSIPSEEKRKESDIQKMDVIKAAKDALVFDAKDAIHQFQHAKVSAMSNYYDFDDDGVEIERDDDEDADEP